MKSLLSWSAHSVIDCPHLDWLPTRMDDIDRQLKRYGYCIVQAWDTSVSPLLSIRQALGRGQFHIRADWQGVVTVSPQASPCHAPLDSSQYFGTTRHPHPPHTDGAYLDGFLWQDNGFKRIEPPAIVLLQCVQPALMGGINLVIDGQRILIDLLMHQPDLANTLAIPGCVSFYRDDQMAVDVAVFEWMAARRLRVRFRSDDALLYPTWAEPAIQELYHNYLMNEKYQKRIDLKEGQILILDNFRVLHGRESFEDTSSASTRYFRRSWIHYENAAAMMTNFLKLNRQCRAFERYAYYGVIEPQIDVPTASMCERGIRVPRHLRALLDGTEGRLMQRAG